MWLLVAARLMCVRFRYSDLKEATLSGAADLWAMNVDESLLGVGGPGFGCGEGVRITSSLKRMYSGVILECARKRSSRGTKSLEAQTGMHARAWGQFVVGVAGSRCASPKFQPVENLPRSQF